MANDKIHGKDKICRKRENVLVGDRKGLVAIILGQPSFFPFTYLQKYVWFPADFEKSVCLQG